MKAYRQTRHGFTLVELLIGAAVLTIAIVALIGAFLGQITLNEHARNLTLTINDANRVMERIRQHNNLSTCAPPGWQVSVIGNACGGSAGNPCTVNCASWDAWLQASCNEGGGGKSIQPNPNVNELIMVDGTGTDPITITVAVCWRHRQRTLGECTWDGAALTYVDGTAPYTAANGIPESPAMLTTLMTCRT